MLSGALKPEINRSADAQASADAMNASALELQRLIDDRRTAQVDAFANLATPRLADACIVRAVEPHRPPAHANAPARRRAATDSICS